jgi:hypothetical protein
MNGNSFPVLHATLRAVRGITASADQPEGFVADNGQPTARGHIGGSTSG